MDITNIKIFPVASNDKTFLGFAECEIDGFLRLSGIGIHATLKQGEISLCYPSKKIGEGQKFYFQPLNKETDKRFRKTIYEECQKIGLFQ